MRANEANIDGTRREGMCWPERGESEGQFALQDPTRLSMRTEMIRLAARDEWEPCCQPDLKVLIAARKADAESHERKNENADEDETAVMVDDVEE